MASTRQRGRSREYPPDFSSSQSDKETQQPPANTLRSGRGCPQKNISTKYKNIITRSTLKSSGCPFIYELKPKKGKIEMLTRMTVGEKNPSKINKTILLVGETGTGKSTLINALINYTMGVKWEDEVWFQIVEEEKRRQTFSQTSDVIVYEIFGFEGKALPYSLTIIDTPGFGDTRGIDKDDIITHRLLDLFGADDAVHEVHAVGLVIKASENRLSDRLRYVFDSVMSLFGKDMEKNIVALITHSDGVTPENALQALEDADIKCAKNEKNQPVHFLFNNHQSKDRTEQDNLGLDFAWRVTERGMNQFTAFLKGSEPQNMMKTLKVLNERIRLKACIQNLKDRVKLCEGKQTEIRQTQEALKKHEYEMQKNEKFTVQVDEVYKVKKPIDGGMRVFFYKAAVCCTVCEENCHYPGCSVVWKPEHCEVIKNGCCTVCTKKCPASAHVKEKWIYVTETRRVQKTMEDIKEKFEKNKSESENKSSLLENAEKEMIHLRAEKKQFLDESYQHVLRLEQIALKADAASTIVHLDFLIEKVKEEGDREKVQKLEKIKKVFEANKSVVQYVFGKPFRKNKSEQSEDPRIDLSAGNTFQTSVITPL